MSCLRGVEGREGPLPADGRGAVPHFPTKDSKIINATLNDRQQRAAKAPKRGRSQTTCIGILSHGPQSTNTIDSFPTLNYKATPTRREPVVA